MTDERPREYRGFMVELLAEVDDGSCWYPRETEHDRGPFLGWRRAKPAPGRRTRRTAS